MSQPPKDDDKIPLDRREFLKAGGLGAAAIAASVAGLVTPESGIAESAGPVPPPPAPTPDVPPGEAAPAIQAGGFRRNMDPMPAAESSMNFAVFTDTHIGQQYRSATWDYAKHLDRLGDDVVNAALPCEFVVHLGDGVFNSTSFVNGIGLPDNLKSNYKNNFAVEPWARPSTYPS